MNCMANKKVGVSLPPLIYDELDRVAEQQGRPPTTLAAFLIEYCLLTGSGISGASQVRADAETYALIDFIKDLAKGNKPTVSSILITAKVTGVEPDQLTLLVDRMCGDNHDEVTESRA